MTYRPVFRPPRRRGSLRGCAGCLFHNPLTIALTGMALILWIGQVMQAAIALAANRPPNLLAVILTTLLLILAQRGPRLAPRLWHRWRWSPRMLHARSSAHASALVHGESEGV